jgi:hypothetical protein
VGYFLRRKKEEFQLASKKVNTVNLKGVLDMNQMEITELAKDGEFTYDFLEILKGFDGKTISLSVKEEEELPVKE